jgi:quinoprotein glucose dehydrogenase
VQKLKPVWEYHTGALASQRSGYQSASFEATPILFHDTLYFATPFDEIVAIDANTGNKRWSYDPHLSFLDEGGLRTSRGSPSGKDRPAQCRASATSAAASGVLRC